MALCKGCRRREPVEGKKSCAQCLERSRVNMAHKRRALKELEQMTAATEEQVKDAIREMVDLCARVCSHSDRMGGMAPATRNEAYRLATNAIHALQLLEKVMRPADVSQADVKPPGRPAAAPRVPDLTPDTDSREHTAFDRLANLVEEIEVEWDNGPLSDDVYALLQGAIGALEGMLALMKAGSE